jgi:hypothetical protein
MENSDLINRLNTAMNMTREYDTMWVKSDYKSASLILSAIKKYKDYSVFCGKLPGKIYFKKEDKKNVSNTSLARFVRRHLKIDSYNLSDRVLETFNNAFVLTFKSEEELLKEVKIYRGQELLDYYVKTKIESCMTGATNSHRIKFFANNPEKVGVIIVGDDLARALIWLADDGRYYIDRGYGCAMPLSLMKKWASINNYILIHPSLYSTITNDFVISDLKIAGVSRLPSMDSIRYGKLSKDEETISATMLGKIIIPNIQFRADNMKGYEGYSSRSSYW